MRLSPEVIQELWVAYKATEDQEVRNELVMHYASLVRHVAGRMASTLPPSVDYDDLFSYGMFGLIDAIGRFDLEAGVKFETYAVTRIRGSIIDELRRFDWVPRAIRSKAREIDRAMQALETELGRPATELELAARLEVDVDELRALRTETTGGQIETLDMGESTEEEGGAYSPQQRLRDATANPEDLFDRTELNERIARGISRLDPRLRRILVLSYLEGLNHKQIGVLLGVTDGRVSQLQAQALAELSKFLRESV